MTTPLKVYKALIWLTTYAAILHFFDNVYFFDQYPEPAWLTAEIVGALLIPIVLLAHRAVDYVYIDKVDYSYSLVHGFVLGNWISLGHYLFASPADILPRINFAIGLQVGLATILFGYTVWMQAASAPTSFRWTLRAWTKNVAIYGVAIAVLEFFWPSNFVVWWMG